MRIYKRFLLMLICASVVFQSLSLVSAKDGVKAEKAFELLSGLNITDNEMKQGEMPIDSAAELIIKLLGSDPGESPVMQAKGMGLIPEGEKRNITVIQYSKALLKLLGYDIFVKTDNDAKKTAASMGLTDGAEIRWDLPISFDNAYIMTYNMLFAAPLVRDGNFAYKKSSYTYLHDNLKIEITEGVMTADSKTGLYDAKSSKNGIGINGVFYGCGKNYDRYIGYTVEAYINKDGEAVYLTPKQGRNAVYEIGGTDITRAVNGKVYYYKNNKSLKENSIKYAESMPLILNGVYNGPLTESEFSIATNKYRNDVSYVFIDNDMDGTADVCIAERYRYFRVETISSNWKYAVDKFSGKTLNFISEDSFFFSNGEKASSANISSDSIIACAVPEGDIEELFAKDSGRDGIDFYIISEEYANVMEGFGRSDNDNYYMQLNGTEYKVNMSYGITPEKVNRDNAVGSVVNVYIDMMGKVILYEMSNTDGVAYIRRVFEDEAHENYMINIYSSYGGHEIKTVSNRVKLTDPTPTVDESNIDVVCRDNAELPANVKIESVLKDKSGNPVSKISGREMFELNINNITGQLVKIGYNQKGEVISIELPRQLCFGEMGRDNEFNIVRRDVILDRLHRISGYENAKKLGNPQVRRRIIMDTYLIGNAAFTYYIPASNIKRFNYVQGSEKDGSYINVDSSNQVNLFLYKMTYETEIYHVGVENRPCIVKKVNTVWKDDAVKLEIEVFFENAYKTFTTENTEMRSTDDSQINSSALYRDIAAADLAFGDIIQINATDDEINAFRLLVDASEDIDNNNYVAYNNDTSDYLYYLNDTFSGNKTFFTTGEYRCGFAEVLEQTNSYMHTKVNNLGGKELNFWPSLFSYRTIVDMGEKTITSAGSYNLDNGQIKAAFYYFLWGADRIFYMYK